ncbi:hypothetical protein [uncultured Sphingomonas sp.]|uniref:hypothetical protein n=1 Tax=uncultured Sphingomonas sp. TaxID=158754 RepID=UPI0025DF7B94|nr:hypothetical protein [uncultured Sphingomonas sp.]
MTGRPDQGEVQGEVQGDGGALERGHHPTFPANGEVHGSGAGAGGGGTPEDFDSDAASGDAGDLQPSRPAPVGTGADASSHNSR